MSWEEWPERPSLRFLVYQSLRRGELCPGELECPNAVDVACMECGQEWRPEDLDIPGACSCCGSEQWKRLRCGTCRTALLDGYDASPAGNLLQRAIDLKLALQAGVNITLDEIGADELRAMQIIDDERSRYDREKEQEARLGQLMQKHS